MLEDSPLSCVGVVAGSRQVPPTSLPIAIAGHGAHSTATTVADPLELNALLFTAGVKRILLISFDLLYVGRTLDSALRSALASRYGLADSSIFFFASHTHFAPPTDPELPELGPYDSAYCEHVKEAALGLIDELFHDTPIPCRLAVRRGQLAHSVNRRRPRLAPSFTRSWGLSFDRVTFAPYPGGERDDTATVVTLCNAATGTPLAILWHYACHPVAHTPAHVTSADYPGTTRLHLRRAAGDTLPILFMQGFCGDVRPNVETRKALLFRDRMLSSARDLIAGTPAMESTAEAWHAWAESLAEGVVRISNTNPVLEEEVVSCESTRLEVPLKKIFDGKLRVESMAIAGILLGQHLELIGFGAEPSAGWRDLLKDCIGPSVQFTLYAGYLGSVFGYLPLPRQLAEGGYEVTNFQQSFAMRGRFRPATLFQSIADAVNQVDRALRSNSIN